MSDQCRHCTLRGKIAECLAVECFHHENWYAKEQQKRIDDLGAKLDSAIDLLDTNARAHLLAEFAKPH